MRILVTGGTGVVGRAAVTALIARGHSVRLLSRHASRECRQWPEGVEPRDASIDSAESLRGAADGCDAVVHLAAIVAEEPPERTFEKVNVEGTRNVVGEAQRAAVRRFVYVSSLGADRGKSEYHVSKREGEKIAFASRLDTTVLRLANVYGPGDTVISMLIKMIRVLPVVPAIDGGEDEFQPMWADDAAAAIAACVEREDLADVALNVAGPDRTSMKDLIARVRDVTGRTPMTVPVTGGMAVAGAKVLSLLGVNIPLDSGQVTMLEEGNLIEHDEDNALTNVLGVKATPLADGLKQLAEALPEQLPEDGIGSIRRKHVWADITGSPLTPEQLFAKFRDHFSEYTPWSMQIGSEPGSATCPTELGMTLTMTLPLRGNVQVRVEDLTERTLTLVTLEGHPLAGAVRFLCEQYGEAIRFQIQVYERAADVPDWLVMRTVGQWIQTGTWKSTVGRVVEESGGESPDGVQVEIVTLDENEGDRIESWIKELVLRRKRDEVSAAVAEQSADASAEAAR